MEAIWKKELSLSEFVAPTQFKTYDELKVRLEYVLGKRGAKPVAQDPEIEEEVVHNSCRRDKRDSLLCCFKFK